MIRKPRDREDAKMRTFLVLIRSVASTHHLAAVTRVGRSVRSFRPSSLSQSDVSRSVRWMGDCVLAGVMQLRKLADAWEHSYRTPSGGHSLVDMSWKRICGFMRIITAAERTLFGWCRTGACVWSEGSIRGTRLTYNDGALTRWRIWLTVFAANSFNRWQDGKSSNACIEIPSHER